MFIKYYKEYFSYLKFYNSFKHFNFLNNKYYTIKNKSFAIFLNFLKSKN